MLPSPLVSASAPADAAIVQLGPMRRAGGELGRGGGLVGTEQAEDRERQRGGNGAAGAGGDRLREAAGAAPEHPVAAALGCGDDPPQVVVGLRVEHADPRGQRLRPADPACASTTQRPQLGDEIVADRIQSPSGARAYCRPPRVILPWNGNAGASAQ